MRNSISFVFLSMLVGCGRLGETPFSLDMSIDLPSAEELGIDIPEGELPEDQEIPQEDLQAFIATDPMDLTAARNEVPKIAQGVIAIDAIQLAMDNTSVGNLGTWISSLKLYASADGALSDDDLVIGDELLEANATGLVMPIGDDIDQMLAEIDELSILIEVELREPPTEAMSVPVTLDAVGFLKVL